MSSIRFNITLPKDIGLKIKGAKNRSALVAQSLREKFERDEKTRLDKELAKGYIAAAKEATKINKEWEPTIGDGL